MPEQDLFIAEPRGKYQALPPIVVDCSVLAALVFEETHAENAREVLSGKALCAPWLIDHEMVSVALKKATSSPGHAQQGLEYLSHLRLTRCPTDRQAQWRLAHTYDLSAYDAAYLQLAVELEVPLVTYDRVLGRAAEEVLANF